MWRMTDRLVPWAVPVIASKEAPGPSEDWRAVQVHWLFSARLESHGTTKHPRQWLFPSYALTTSNRSMKGSI